MNITLQPTKLLGSVAVPSSKSMAHRLLICASFANACTELVLTGINEDIVATAEGLHLISRAVRRTDYGFLICPKAHNVDDKPDAVYINCHESGSTLRFLLPIVGALGIDATFEMEGRLPQRPLSPLWEEMVRMGCRLTRYGENLIRCTGQLRPGKYYMDGSISSQFISGLLMAFPLINGETSLEITGKIESKPYIHMTQYVLDLFREGCPARIEVEGDWSSAAFWLAANALGSRVTVANLNDCSPQGDKEVVALLQKLESHCTISAADFPDLIPILSVVAAAKNGAVFTDVQRLRLKESDRVASIVAMIESLGGKAEATEHTLTVYSTGLKGGVVDSFGDHRIAMAAAIAATVCREPVTVLGAECVKKSYPDFWENFQMLRNTWEVNHGINLW